MADFAAATVAWQGNTITLLELTKTLNNLESRDTSQDEMLSLWLQMAGEAAESYIDNKIVLQEVTEEFRHQRWPIALRYWPVEDTLTAVSLDGEDTLADWLVFRRDGLQFITKDKSGKGCVGSFEQLDVTYNAGSDPIPAELGYVLAATAIAYDSKAGGVSGQVKKEVIQGVGSVEYATNEDAPGSVGSLSPSSISVLDRYRRLYS